MAVKKRPPDIQQPNLRIVTNPVETFHKPEPPELPPDAPARTDLLRLAQSLSGTNEQLGEWARIYTRNTAEAGANEAFGLRLRNPRRDVERMLTTPGGVPSNVNRIALEMGHGEDLARDFTQDLYRRYLGQSTAPTGQPSNAFDRNTGDLATWFAEQLREREGALPSSENVRHGWQRTLREFQERLFGLHAQHLGQRTTQENLDRAHQDFYGIATDAIAGGERDARAIHLRMLEATTRAGQLYRLTTGQTNAALFSAARSIAEQGIPGNPALAVALVREILLGQRPGPNGTTLPPLGNSQEYAHLTNQTIERATNRAGELQRTLELSTIVRFREEAHNGRLDEEAARRFFADNPHIMGPNSQAHLEQLLVQNRTAVDRARQTQAETANRIARQAASDEDARRLNEFLRLRGEEGTLLSIPERMTLLKPDGTTGEVQRPELLDRARDLELARIAEWARQQRQFELDVSMSGSAPGGPSMEQRIFDREYDFVHRNGLTHPRWRDILSSGYTAATPGALAGTPPPVLLEAVQLYETLEARAPGILERHLPSQAARDFYRTYRLGRTLLRMEERQALAFAATATNDVGADESRAPSFQRIDQELGRAQSIWPWAETITNFGDMHADIRRLARGLVRSGMAPDEAVRLAGEDVRGQYTNINGFMVRTGDRHLESYGVMLRAAGLQPTTFAESVRRYLERYAQDNPAAVAADTVELYGVGTVTSGGRRLSITPSTGGTGAWVIIDAATGLPVPSGSSGMRQTIGMRDLLEFERRTQTEAATTEAERLARETRRRQRREFAEARRRTPALLRDWPDDALPDEISLPDRGAREAERRSREIAERRRLPTPLGGWPDDAPSE